MNPYQSPPTIDDAIAIADDGDPRIDWIPTALAGLRWIQNGCRVVLFFVSILVVYGMLTPGSNPYNIVIGSIFIGTLLGMASIAMGMVTWLTVSRLSIAALVLHLIGGSGVAIYSDVMLRDRPTSELIHLFGASTLAMLLTAQASAEGTERKFVGQLNHLSPQKTPRDNWDNCPTKLLALLFLCLLGDLSHLGD